MKDASSVITTATSGIVDKLAVRREISLRRMHEILGPDNPYPKAKRLIRDIAEFNTHGVRLIKADLDAMFLDLLLTGDGEAELVTAAEVHKEAFEAVDAILTGKSAAVQLEELRELIAVAELKISGIKKLQTRNNLAPVA
jgi:hypothetical protein